MYTAHCTLHTAHCTPNGAMSLVWQMWRHLLALLHRINNVVRRKNNSKRGDWDWIRHSRPALAKVFCCWLYFLQSRILGLIYLRNWFKGSTNHNNRVVCQKGLTWESVFTCQTWNYYTKVFKSVMVWFNSMNINQKNSRPPYTIEKPFPLPHSHADHPSDSQDPPPVYLATKPSSNSMEILK